MPDDRDRRRTAAASRARRSRRYEEARSVVAAVAVPGRKVASELAFESDENEDDADGVDVARERRREAACGEDADDEGEGEEERKERARRERETGETSSGGSRRRKRRERSGRLREAGRRRREETCAWVRRLRSSGAARADGQVDGAVWWRMSARSLTKPESEVVGAALVWPAGCRRGGGGIWVGEGDRRRSRRPAGVSGWERQLGCRWRN
jgi:hypothetical protein